MASLWRRLSGHAVRRDPDGCVIDDAVFDQVFAELVQSNNKGAIVTGPSGRGIALTEDNVDRLVTSKAMAPSGAACLELAWRHREL
jgi:hypothetical protein